jgi:hypothetical protein
MPLDEARLDFELARDQMERALGRGGAPVDLARARAALPRVDAALRLLSELLQDVPG